MKVSVMGQLSLSILLDFILIDARSSVSPRLPTVGTGTYSIDSLLGLSRGLPTQFSAPQTPHDVYHKFIRTGAQEARSALSSYPGHPSLGTTV